MKAQRQLIYEQPRLIKLLEDNVDKLKALIEAFIPEWKKLSGQALTIELLNSFFDGGNNPVKTEVIELLLMREIAAKANLSSPLFDEAKVLQMLKRPDISPLVAKLEPFGSVYDHTFRSVTYWQCFKVDNDKVNVLEDEVEKLREGFREYATTVEELERLELAKGVITAFNKVWKKNPDISASNFRVAGLVMVIDGSIYPSPVFVQRGTFDGGFPVPYFTPSSPTVTDIRKQPPGNDVSTSPMARMVYGDDNEAAVINFTAMAEERNKNNAS